MRLFEAILAANHRAAAGDPNAGLARDDFTESLPVIALTCIDARLNRLLPAALGIAEHDFIWLRNAGNIITGPLSSTLRSLALACAIKGGREIAVIGHTDCLVGATTMIKLLERFGSLGLDRLRLPENLVEYFGLFASERQNVLRAVEIIRSSPLIGPRVPVHGLLLDTASGQLEWLVNGYFALDAAFPNGPTLAGSAAPSLGQVLDNSSDLVGALGSTLHELIGHFRTATPAEAAPQPTSPIPEPLPIPLPKPAAPKPVFTKLRRH